MDNFMPIAFLITINTLLNWACLTAILHELIEIEKRMD